MTKKTPWILLALSLALSACSAAPAPAPSDQKEPDKQEENTGTTSLADQDFDKWLEDLFIETCSQDYTTAHQYFIDPEAQGITVDADSLTLGDFVATEQEKQQVKDTLKELRAFDTSKLCAENQQIVRQLIWQYDLEDRSNDEKFDYIATIWSEMSGVPSSLVNFFSEYQLYDEKNIEPLIALINDTPNYVQKALDYSKKQADLGMLRLNLKAVTEDCQGVLDSRDDSPITKELDLEVDSLGLDQAKADEYKTKIHEALQASFFPAFQTMIDGLNDLSGQIGPILGLASYPNGEEYYELLIENYAGTDKSLAEIQKECLNRMQADSDQYNAFLDKNQDAVIDAMNLQTSFESVSEILPFLEENYSKDFPTVKPMEYELEALSNEQSSEGIVAYFLVPPIDSTRPYEMRYNKRDYGDDPSAMSMYDTLAHEGIPGHMYQTQYEKEHFTKNGQYLLSSMGMQEGYATYAAIEAQKWLELDPAALQVHNLDEDFSNQFVLLLDILINSTEGYTKNDLAKDQGGAMDELYDQLAENPGVFFSYNYGCSTLLDMRQKAEDELGDKFDSVGFNNALLQAGNVRFDIVQENIDAWIAQQQK